MSQPGSRATLVPSSLGRGALEQQLEKHWQTLPARPPPHVTLLIIPSLRAVAATTSTRAATTTSPGATAASPSRGRTRRGSAHPGG